MSEIVLRENFDVELVDSMGSDELICKAARVSTLGAASIESRESAGLIKFLMQNRHGSPFEHGSLVYRISAPIFVWREFMRHRIGISYNEQSGRYMEMEPIFYIPPTTRDFVQSGKPGAYSFGPGTREQWEIMMDTLAGSYDLAWHNYQHQMKFGIAKEVARMCLPVGIYSTAYVTMNPRSIMHFLSLRTKHESSKFPSYPMWEINQVANQIEVLFNGLFPLTHQAFCDAGRVAP